MLKQSPFLLPLLLLTLACSDDTADLQPEPKQKPDGRMAVSIDTRATDGVAADGLQAGLFMVNWREGRPDELLTANNYVHNQLLTWNGSGWQTDTPIYWYDDTTPADFYAYAPRTATVGNARQMGFSVQTDQRTADAFAKSDLLWGKVDGQSPSASTFSLMLNHVLCRLTVQVTADAGFDEGELKADDVSVTIGGTHTHGTLDNATGMVSTVDGSTAVDVLCHSNGDLSYTAILLPQQVPFSNLIQVNWQGNRYTLQNSFTLEAGRQYTLAVKLKKTKSGFDIGIEGWDIVPEDFGGSIGG